MNRQFESGLVAAFLIFVWSRPSKTAWILTLALGSLGMAFYCGPPVNPYCGVPASAISRCIQALVYCGCAAIVTTPFLPLFQRRLTGYASLMLFRDMLIPPLLTLVSAFSIVKLIEPRLVSYDQYLYLFDGSLGFQPGFWAERVMRHFGWLQAIGDEAYFYLPLALTAAYLIERDASRESAKRTLRLFILLGVAGFTCFHLFPAIGAKLALPDVFPYTEPRIALKDVSPVVVLPGPNNSMPSLHTSWILAIWWMFDRRSRWFRAVLAAILGLMLLSTLTRHYLVDMAVAFPFTLALTALTRGLGSRLCHRTFQWGALLYFGWLLILRFTPGVFLISPLIGWAAMLLTVMVCDKLRRAMDRVPATEKVEPNPRPLLEPAPSSAPIR